MTPDEVLEARRFVRAKVTELKEKQPTAQRKITLRELMDQHLADWRSARDEHRSPRTEAGYRELWDTHILPFALDSERTLGEMTIQDITPQLAQRVKLHLPKVVTSRHPLAKRGGTVVTNRALQQLQAAFKFAFRMGMVPGNPFSEEIIVRYAERSDGYSFSDQELKAIGAALERLEALTARPRPPLPYRSLAGIRLLFLTGARPSELTEAYIDKRHLPSGCLDPYAILDDPFPRIHVQRAKGDILARAFIVATLPHSRPSGNEFTRRNGYYRLTLLAPTEIGLPYGRYPRLALAWMTTRAVKTKSPYLELGLSFSRFAQSLGITPTTGPRGTLSGLREQVHRLLSVSLSCHWDTTEAPNMADRGSKGHTGYNLCYQHQLWWDHAKNEPSWLLLNTDFFNELATRPVRST